MEIHTGTLDDLAPEMAERLARYRYKVFVETLRWRLPARYGLELDQFDRPDTLYVVATEGGRVIGGTRLLPTTKPYLLGEVFPQLLGDASVPRSPGIWELSRFAAVDLSAKAPALFPFASRIAFRLLQAAIDAAIERRGERLITVSPKGIERLLRLAGFRARRDGPPLIIDGQAFFACFIECQPGAARAVPGPYGLSSAAS